MANYLECPLAQGLACLSDLNTLRKNGDLAKKPASSLKLIGTATVSVGGLLTDGTDVTPIGVSTAAKLSDAERKQAQTDCEELALFAQSSQAGPYGSWLSVGLIWLVQQLAKILGLSIPA